LGVLWLRKINGFGADPPLAVAFVTLTIGGLVLLAMHVFLDVPSLVGTAGWALLGSGVLGVAITAFVLSRRHGLGVLRSLALAVKTVFRWIFTFAP
jgi:hypothetical protein